MGDSQPKKGGKNLTTSATRRARYADYKVQRLREKHKIKRVLQSCGMAFVEQYARVRMLSGYLAALKPEASRK